MNYKSIGFLALTVLAFVSCKKEVEVKNVTQGTEIITDQSSKAKVTQELKVVDPNAKYAQMSFSKLEHDFGTINGEDQVETVFSFTNTGEADLVISNAKGSCGCTVPEYPKQPIAPGEKADIKVSFSPKGKNGMQNKTVTLTTNTAKGMEMLTVKANIVK
ncbi:DUF1573 domain-containing protein [Flavobacterium antarcticum]|uniref:DUF1573 domain-containing protein n=1 Tax=Flavobacterium antarcticum TaxID=271155 RepID=UPI0003B4E8CC|nr:DUF1573 domain-containing protein [Flavobacterium antarcticum]